MKFSFLRFIANKAVLCICLLGLTQSLYAQTAFKVTYYISDIKLQGSIDNLDERGKRFTKQVIEHAKDINYILIANQEASYFSQEDALSKDSDSPLDLMLTRAAKRFANFNEKTYANHKEDSIVFVKNLVSQDFKVKRGYYNFNWTIKEDSKKILGYEARKAQGKYFYPVTKEELTVEAWFIPAIPVQSGPDIFMGLPGLIAEVHLKGAVVSAKEIEADTSLKINKVDESKAMTQEEFNELIKGLTKKYIDN